MYDLNPKKRVRIDSAPRGSKPHPDKYFHSDYDPFPFNPEDEDRLQEKRGNKPRKMRKER